MVERIRYEIGLESGQVLEVRSPRPKFFAETAINLRDGNGELVRISTGVPEDDVFVRSSQVAFFRKAAQ